MFSRPAGYRSNGGQAGFFVGLFYEPINSIGRYSNKKRGLRKKTTMAVSHPVPTEPSDREENSFPDPADTPYREACRRSWAKLIAKIYLVSSLYTKVWEGSKGCLGVLSSDCLGYNPPIPWRADYPLAVTGGF